MKHLKLLRIQPLNVLVNTKDSLASNMLFYSGVFILLSALIYMIGNLYRADLIIRIWFPFMIVGVILVFMSQLIKLQFPKVKR